MARQPADRRPRNPAPEEARAAANESFVSVEFLATVFGMTTRNVQTLVTNGVIRREDHGRYPLVASLQAYIRHVKSGSVAARGAAGAQSGALDFNVEKARLTKAKREREELRLANERNELVRVSDVSAIVGDEYARIRSRMLAVTPRVAVRLAYETSPQVVEQVLGDEIARALTELSEAEAVTAKSVERNRDVTGMTDGGDEDDQPEEDDGDGDGTDDGAE